MELGLAGLATGAVERIWYSESGDLFYARTPGGQTFVTSDFETWRPSAASAPVVIESSGWRAVRMPEAGARIRETSGRIYAFGMHGWRSTDNGRSWDNLTQYRRDSILGGALRDLAVSPRNPEEITVACETGVWRSLDGGLSWTGVNDSLPALSARRITGLPDGERGVRIATATAEEFEWVPGEKRGWRPVETGEAAAREAQLKRRLKDALGVTVRTVSDQGSYIYAGSADGRLWSSADQGQSWREQISGLVEAIFVDPQEPRVALAAFAQAPGQARLLRTVNGGLYWDDVTANLPNASVHGVAAERVTGTVYVATDAGVFQSRMSLTTADPAAPSWSLMTGLPVAAAMDVRLDNGANQLYVALSGYGVYATAAPHRTQDPRLVNAADFTSRAAAPGSLLSVVGAGVTQGRAGTLPVPVLAASPAESQIQVPFEAAGAALSLVLESTRGRFVLDTPLAEVSPAIFVDRDGAPMLLDAASGVMLDAATPARAGSRVQILATGLGRVRPDWPTGLAAPLESPPQVVAPVRAFLDGFPVDVLQATLAPGYVGFYLIEVRLPEMVNRGAAILSIEAGGRTSNRVRVFVEQ